MMTHSSCIWCHHPSRGLWKKDKPWQKTGTSHSKHDVQYKNCWIVRHWPGLLDHGIPYSDYKDNETPNTRSYTRRIIQTIAVNSNSGQISDINQQDLDRIKELNTFFLYPWWNSTYHLPIQNWHKLAGGMWNWGLQSRW